MHLTFYISDIYIYIYIYIYIQILNNVVSQFLLGPKRNANLQLLEFLLFFKIYTFGSVYQLKFAFQNYCHNVIKQKFHDFSFATV